MNSYINMITKKNSKRIEWVHSITCLTFSYKNDFQITFGCLLKYQREVSIERLFGRCRKSLHNATRNGIHNDEFCCVKL